MQNVDVTALRPKSCIQCGMELPASTGILRCVNCGFEYDHETTVFVSKFGAYHFVNNWRVSLSALILMAIQVTIGLVTIAALGDRALRTARLCQLIVMIAFVLTWSLLAKWNRRLAISNPFVAITPVGVLVSRLGRPGQWTVLGWDEVRRRFRTTGSGWSFQNGALSSIGIGLDKEQGSRCYELIKNRADNPLPSVPRLRAEAGSQVS